MTISFQEDDMTSLIIVESFTKTKTISKYLGSGYTVICSLGHFKDLPSKELGIDTNTWNGRYVTTNKKIAKNITEKVKTHDTIYIASDPDVEGEAIAYHIKSLIKDTLKGKACYRIKFNEISKSSILEAIERRGIIDMDVVMAQETRRFVDRLVGYKLSPFLWKRFNNYRLSVGRVQSIALSLCAIAVDESGSSGAYWVIKTVDSLKLEMRWHEKEKVVRFNSKEGLMETLACINLLSKTSVESCRRSSMEHPPPPYTTTSMQQDAYNKFKFTAKRTMKLAQDLYEGGHITYMRTDSVSISADFSKKIASFVLHSFGEGLMKPREFKSKANSQEAHEAIRMTEICKRDADGLSKDHQRLYDAIWKRTVASQMADAEYTNLDIKLFFENSRGCFYGTRSFLVVPGFLLLYDKKIADVWDRDVLDGIAVQSLLCQASFDSSPPYNEVGLIKRLEKEGIGRPSTYATIMDKLLEKNYAEVGKLPENVISVSDYTKTVGGIKESERMVNVVCKSSDLVLPTELGRAVLRHMSEGLSFVLDISFTRELEEELDNIMKRKDTKIDVLNRFYCSYIEPVMCLQ